MKARLAMLTFVYLGGLLMLLSGPSTAQSLEEVPATGPAVSTAAQQQGWGPWSDFQNLFDLFFEDSQAAAEEQPTAQSDETEPTVDWSLARWLEKNVTLDTTVSETTP